MEHAPHRRRLLASRDALDRTVGHQVEVQLRSVALNCLRERGGECARRNRTRVKLDVTREECLQVRQLVARAELEAVHQHDGLQRVVHHHRKRRVLEAPDVDDLVVEQIVRSAHPAHVVSGALPGRGIRRRDHQHLEVGFLRCRRFTVRRQRTEPRTGGIARHIPGERVAAEIACQKGPRDFLDETREPLRVAPLQRLADRGKQPPPRVRPAVFDPRNRAKQFDDVGITLVRVLARCGHRSPRTSQRI